MSSIFEYPNTPVAIRFENRTVRNITNMYKYAYFFLIVAINYYYMHVSVWFLNNILHHLEFQCTRLVCKYSEYVNKILLCLRVVCVQGGRYDYFVWYALSEYWTTVLVNGSFVQTYSILYCRENSVRIPRDDFFFVTLDDDVIGCHGYIIRWHGNKCYKKHLMTSSFGMVTSCSLYSSFDTPICLPASVCVQSCSLCNNKCADITHRAYISDHEHVLNCVQVIRHFHDPKCVCSMRSVCRRYGVYININI